MMGTKTANSTKNTPKVAEAYLTSDKALKSTEELAFFGGNRVRTVRHATEQRTAQIKAMMRIDHAKPTFGAANMMIRGNMTPPNPPAVHAIPVAQPRRTLNQWPTAATGGVNSVLADIPPSTLKERNIW